MNKARPVHYLLFILLALLSALLLDRSRGACAENPLNGFWRSENGSIVHITGGSGVLVETAVEDWKPFINRTTIKNIRPSGSGWVANEWLMSGAEYMWVEALWRPHGNKIRRFLMRRGQVVETYFIRTDAPAPDGQKEPAPRRPAGWTSRHRFEVAPLVLRFRYEEPSVMSEEGFLYGLMGRYVYDREAVLIESLLQYAAGSLDYDGSTWGGSPLSSDTDDHLLEVRTLIGGNLYAGNHTITPFIGFGARYWNNTIEAPGGYEREVLYLYSPIGLKLAGPLASNWWWSLSGEYDLFLKGWVTSHLSDADPGFNDPENHQGFGDGFGVRFSFQVRHQLSDEFAWYLEPFFRYWEVDASDYARLTYYGAPLGVVYEPENNTLSYGVTVGFAF